MSSLHENVSRRRAAESPELACVTLQPDSAALIVCQWRGASWVLPWSHFASARLTGNDGDGQLELTFSHCLVILTGANLRGLIDDLAAFRVACLRDLPANYRPPAGDAVPFVTGIEVRPSREIRETPG